MQRKAYIIPEKCDGSPFCPAMRYCPKQAITMEKRSGLSFLNRGIARVNDDLCTGCGICLKHCPRNAVTIREGVA